MHGNVIGLSLIKSAIAPDETADRGIHEFIYMLYPHAEDVKHCKVQKLVTALNTPLLCIQGTAAVGKSIAAEGLFTMECDHTVIDTVKKAHYLSASLWHLPINQKDKVIQTFCRAIVRLQKIVLSYI